MSDSFWLDKLRQSGGAPPPPPAAPQGGLTPTGAPWWAHPTYTQPQQPAQPQQPPEALQRAYETEKAQSAKQTDLCPSCRSEHYWRPTPNTTAMCFDCGWPVQNSTQGVAISNNSSAPTRQSVHQAKGSGYQPNVIVGRL
ncbi:hypothetical protein ACFRMO_07745 [Streptomyces anulatus]|uniref:hypothetical protein n=1 Tax=Streptomyces anulatus TaxID=1892 RepID=UPI0036B83D1F